MVSAAEGSTESNISTGAGHINAPIAGSDMHYYTPQETEEKTPHIYPKLQIDSLDEEPGYVTIHFELTNGDTPVENIRLSVAATHNNLTEYGSVSGAMAPHAELSTFANLFKRTANDHDLVKLTHLFCGQGRISR